ncbi:2-phospho-L-lactate guanylyltransferase [Methanomicrobium sp. W14]|uniref:2-phospho-L-lactate guanylyltransferase n=1 Tax=Methanomicrobium sp. W14 TaxID=2817839 RepID=UPI001AE62186|nr:2-phospho-L-lactate guanylyltransferase [Methanomicrobium sp. W14]
MVNAVIPFRPTNPKTRLSCILSREEREQFAMSMLEDVVFAISRAGCSPVILSTTEMNFPGAETVVMELGLNEALNMYLSDIRGPVLIFMSDIPLLTKELIKKIISTEKDCAMVPGRGGGTNSIFVRDPQKFHVDFYGASFVDHMNIAKEQGLTVEVIDSFRLSTDIDEKEDLVEIFLHSEGKSRKYLESLGISVSIEKGRVGVHRNPHEEAF